MPDSPSSPHEFLELLEQMKHLVDIANTLKQQFIEQGWSDRNAEQMVVSIYRNMNA